MTFTIFAKFKYLYFRRKAPRDICHFADRDYRELLSKSSANEARTEWGLEGKLSS